MVYNLNVDNNHTYYVELGGTRLLTHNANYNSGEVFASRGSTGRTTPGGAVEAEAMDLAKQYPEHGVTLKVRMKDERRPAEEGRVKMELEIKGVYIHYVRNVRTGWVDDFKFKDWMD